MDNWENWQLVAADLFFIAFHTVLILFNLFAWLWKPLQKWHLLVIGLTFGSWLILGIWYGLGYCPLTDWHWDILYAKGENNLPRSYVAYLLYRFFKIAVDAFLIDILTVVTALLALIGSIWVNFFNKDRNA